MNHVRSALLPNHRPHHLAAAPQQLAAAASFHSTPVLQRKRKNQWQHVTPLFPPFIHSPFSVLNICSPSFHSIRKGGFEFCTSDEDEPETVFRNAFRHQHTYYWSFSSDDFQWRNSRRHSENSRNWSGDTDDEDEVSAPSEVSLARQALGLNTSGPLKLEDVKNAYRACALRWHPDRHNGSSKATAEEKFKHCSAAYKTFSPSFNLFVMRHQPISIYSFPTPWLPVCFIVVVCSFLTQ
ncbi:hypothetical protein PR202_ga25324 [Eleusine coracana subsp. coracana]|uniref:J domain-containing protein n=1 Tax=Eleusine coracana subsp. coracana TaxID=191504 RepID=A0AAV5DAN3_ELECO|nr:hypothetical protein PR202_ga25324 [Eleusine coracana subsp. coracana]